MELEYEEHREDRRFWKLRLKPPEYDTVVYSIGWKLYQLAQMSCSPEGALCGLKELSAGPRCEKYSDMYLPTRDIDEIVVVLEDFAEQTGRVADRLVEVLGSPAARDMVFAFYDRRYVPGAKQLASDIRLEKQVVEVLQADDYYQNLPVTGDE